jgi:hypothetical protein
MAAVSDRLWRALPFNPLKPFDRHRFADLAAPRRCAPAQFPSSPHQSPGHASLANTASAFQLASAKANRLNQNTADSGIPTSIQAKDSSLYLPRSVIIKGLLLAFDLWRCEDVAENARIIFERLEAADMQCERLWPEEHISRFRDRMSTPSLIGRAKRVQQGRLGDFTG